MNFDPSKNHRILLIDDDESIHNAFRKILGNSSVRDVLDEDEAALFGESAEQPKRPTFEIDSVYHGEEGLDLIEKSLLENRPYAMAFVDVRMGPGWDGVQTTCKIWEKYPDLQVVLCTGFADRSWEEMVRTLGYLDRMIVLIKPFNNIEVFQLAVAMTEKWRLNQQAKLRLDNLEKLVQSAWEIYLPQVETLPKPPDVHSAPSNLPRGTETILLAEDDSALLEMSTTLLKRLGYTVLVVANGIDVLSLQHQRYVGHFDLLFTDIVLPQISDKEFSDRIRAIYPHTKILFTSACTQNSAIHQGMLNEGVAVLQKPFTPSALANKVREILDR
jgi:CheY-like chemotaxis protein